MTTKQIANLIPDMMALELVGENLKGIPKMDGSGRGKRLNRGRGGCKQLKDNGIINKGVKNIVGLGLISSTSKIVSDI